MKRVYLAVLAVLICAALAASGLAVAGQVRRGTAGSAPAIASAEVAVTAPSPSPVPTPVPTLSPAEIAAAEQAEQQAVEALDNYLDSMDGVVSVYCIRLSDGYCYAYCPDTTYYTASLLKAPYALWLCQRADAGELDLNTTLESWLGTPERTALEAMAAMITYSDNDAAGQLYHTWPAEAQGPFAEFLATMDIDRPDNALTDETNIQGIFSARDAGNLLVALAEYVETDSDNAAALKEAMLAADHPLLESDWPMARKYGSWEDALHDMAIVYSDDPYCIAVLTSWGDTEQDFPEPGASRIREIGHLAETLMETALPLTATAETAE